MNHEHAIVVPGQPAYHSRDDINVFILHQITPIDFDAGCKDTRVLDSPLEVGNSYGILTVT